MRGSLTRTERSIVAPRTVTHRVALLALILMLGAPRAARATSCVEDALERSFRNADAVFLGVIESSRPSFRHPLTMTVNRVRVLRAWKGVTEDRVNLTWVESDRWMGDKVFWDAVRGIPFSGSDTLVVAAWWHEGALATGFCTFTLARYGGAQTATALLGPGTVPTARASVVHVGLWWPWPAVVGAVLLATAGLLRLWRQARSGHTR